MPTDRVKKICPAAASQVLGSSNPETCGSHTKLSPSSGLWTTPRSPGWSSRPRIASAAPKPNSNGIPILAAISIPLAKPRDRSQTLRVSVSRNQKSACPGMAKTEPSSMPRYWGKNAVGAISRNVPVTECQTYARVHDSM